MQVLGYIVGTLVCSGLFLVAYRWLLMGKVGYRMCRAFILAGMVLAALPWTRFPLWMCLSMTRPVSRLYFLLRSSWNRGRLRTLPYPALSCCRTGIYRTLLQPRELSGEST